MCDRRLLWGKVSLLALSAAGILVGAPAADARVKNSDHVAAVADLRRIRLRGRRAVRKDRRQSIRRARSQGLQECRHRRSSTRAKERGWKGRVRVRFLHLE